LSRLCFVTNGYDLWEGATEKEKQQSTRTDSPSIHEKLQFCLSFSSGTHLRDAVETAQFWPCCFVKFRNAEIFHKHFGPMETSDQLVICLPRGHVPEGSGFKDFKLPTEDNFLHHLLKEFDYLT